MRYDTILLDADGTLFDFHRAEKEAFYQTFSAYGLPARRELLARYIEINEALWRDLEKGLVEKERLKTLRFFHIFDWMKAEGDCDQSLRSRLDSIDVDSFAEDYLTNLGRGHFLLPGALELCRELAGSCGLYIATNGISRVQQSRLEASLIRPYIKNLFVSEAVGAAKPQKAYFDYVFRALGLDTADKLSRTIILGDSLTSDMAGGAAAGIDTCWYAPGGLPEEGRPPVTYWIKELGEFRDIAEGRRDPCERQQ